MAASVGDSKLVGPVGNLAKGWSLIRQCLTLGEPTDFATHLGCEHRRRTVKLKYNGKVVEAVEYDMESFLMSCVGKYAELVHPLRGANR